MSSSTGKPSRSRRSRLAVQHRQGRQQPTQQHHHLTGAEHQLPFRPFLQQVGITAALLPLPR
jgi:hypothetical protein